MFTLLPKQVDTLTIVSGCWPANTFALLRLLIAFHFCKMSGSCAAPWLSDGFVSSFSSLPWNLLEFYELVTLFWLCMCVEMNGTRVVWSAGRRINFEWLFFTINIVFQSLLDQSEKVIETNLFTQRLFLSLALGKHNLIDSSNSVLFKWLECTLASVHGTATVVLLTWWRRRLRINCL